jgi:hypothetical protein
MSEEKRLVDAVALALWLSSSSHMGTAEAQRLAKRAIAAIHANERCAGCGCQLQGPAMCPECACDEGKNARTEQQ